MGPHLAKLRSGFGERHHLSMVFQETKHLDQGTLLLPQRLLQVRLAVH